MVSLTLRFRHCLSVAVYGYSRWVGSRWSGPGRFRGPGFEIRSHGRFGFPGMTHRSPAQLRQMIAFVLGPHLPFAFGTVLKFFSASYFRVRSLGYSYTTRMAKSHACWFRDPTPQTFQTRALASFSFTAQLSNSRSKNEKTDVYFASSSTFWRIMSATFQICKGRLVCCLMGRG